MAAAGLDDLLAFTGFTHDIRNVKRAMLVRDEDQYENDAEHSYQLALISLYIIEHDKLPLDPYKSMALALVHDILEVHAGDTFLYGPEVSSKPEREKEAVRLLRKQWPKQKHMLNLIDEYELLSSQEAKFIFALDKLLPILNNILDNGRSWKKAQISLEQIVTAKTKKISVDQDIQRYFEMALELLRTKPDLFTTK